MAYYQKFINRYKPFIMTVDTTTQGADSSPTTDFVLPLQNGYTYRCIVDWGDGSTDNITKVSSVEQWGNVVWKSMDNTFYGCSNMVGNFTDAPILEKSPICNAMFRGCSSFNTELLDWDTSQVTNMSSMFRETSFNNSGSTSMSGWSTSNVTTTGLMFYLNPAFNQNIGNWEMILCFLMQQHSIRVVVQT